MSTLDPSELSRIVEMAWEDRTPFEAIQAQFQLSEPEVKALMRSVLKPSSYRLWPTCGSLEANQPSDARLSLE